MSDESNVDIKQLFEKRALKTNEFSSLLDNIKYASRETKKLWLEIYENAVDDRANAYVLFLDLYQFVVSSQQGHVNHGPMLAKYMERLEKANSQLLRLSELVGAADDGDENVDAEALYASFENHK